ncbi:MAG: hypothetical protein NTX29_05655 [Actinobacteria bacterium]|nr:hypothetical protein [Actinomycetota bacterium]
MNTGGIALLWGPPRSGTTWLYNVVRGVAACANIRAEGWVQGHPPPDPRQFDARVVKSHQAHAVETLRKMMPHPNIHLVGIFRDPTQAFASLVRTQSAPRQELLTWLTRDIESIDSAFGQLPGALLVREEWIANRGAEVVRALASHLNAGLSPVQCMAIAHQYSRDNVNAAVSDLSRHFGWSGTFTEYDPDSHWHANHIAPKDHPQLTVTAQESAELERLAMIVDRLTVRHSILNDAADADIRMMPIPISHQFLRAATDRPRRRLRLPQALLRR